MKIDLKHKDLNCLLCVCNFFIIIVKNSIHSRKNTYYIKISNWLKIFFKYTGRSITVRKFNYLEIGDLSETIKNLKKVFHTGNKLQLYNCFKVRKLYDA